MFRSAWYSLIIKLLLSIVLMYVYDTMMYPVVYIGGYVLLSLPDYRCSLLCLLMMVCLPLTFLVDFDNHSQDVSDCFFGTYLCLSLFRSELLFTALLTSGEDHDEYVMLALATITSPSYIRAPDCMGHRLLSGISLNECCFYLPNTCGPNSYWDDRSDELTVFNIPCLRDGSEYWQLGNPVQLHLRVCLHSTRSCIIRFMNPSRSLHSYFHELVGQDCFYG